MSMPLNSKLVIGDFITAGYRLQAYPGQLTVSDDLD